MARESASTTEDSAEDVVGALLETHALSATAEHVSENVVETTRAVSAGREACSAAHRANLVVFLAGRGVRQNRVRLTDFLKTRFGLGVAGVGVRVEFTGELAIHLFQIRVRDVLRDAENGVKVLIEPVLACHGRPSSRLFRGGGDSDLGRSN